MYDILNFLSQLICNKVLEGRKKRMKQENKEKKFTFHYEFSLMLLNKLESEKQWLGTTCDYKFSDTYTIN